MSVWEGLLCHENVPNAELVFMSEIAMIIEVFGFSQGL